jgi:hypothetical protein
VPSTIARLANSSPVTDWIPDPDASAAPGLGSGMTRVVGRVTGRSQRRPALPVTPKPPDFAKIAPLRRNSIDSSSFDARSVTHV